MNKMSKKALKKRNEDIRNGKLKKEWLKDKDVLSFINALYEKTS